MFVAERCVVKGLVAGIIQTRNIFTAEVEYNIADTREDVWMWYLDAIYAAIVDTLSPLFTITEIECFTRSGGDWLSVDSWTYAFTGNGGGDSYNSMIAGVLIGKGLGLRKVGRKFFGPLAEMSVNGNVLVAGALVYFANALIHYVSPIVTTNGSTLVPGIWDKDNLFRSFTGGVVSPLLGTCRRRKQAAGI